MISIIFTAFFVGFLHSANPGHWIPLVSIARLNHWSLREIFKGAILASSGHFLSSLGVSVLSVWLASKSASSWDPESVEKASALTLIVGGLCFSFFQFNRHSRCTGHSHHGPDPEKSKKPHYWFIFLVGFTPCFAIAPVLVSAGLHGSMVSAVSILAYVAGVFSALILAVTITIKGLLKLDFPFLEHHADTLTGISVALGGCVLLFTG